MKDSEAFALTVDQRLKLGLLLGEMGITNNDTTVEQAAVLLQALRVFEERNARYKDVWRGSGWRGSLYDLRKKVTRMWQVFWTNNDSAVTRAEDVDDALDVINFAAFFVRNHAANNEHGLWG